MHAAGRLIEHFPGTNDPLRLPAKLKANFALQHVTQDESRVLMRMGTWELSPGA